MISMLKTKDRVESTVKKHDQYEIDYLHDKEANRIELWLCIWRQPKVLSGFLLRIGTLMPKKKMGRSFRFGSRR
jgi:hypothetical protein